MSFPQAEKVKDLLNWRETQQFLTAAALQVEVETKQNAKRESKE